MKMGEPNTDSPILDGSQPFRLQTTARPPEGTFWSIHATFLRLESPITTAVLPEPSLIASGKSLPVCGIAISEMLGIVGGRIPTAASIFPAAIQAVAIAFLLPITEVSASCAAVI